jgi:hypothetical protein
MRSMPRPADSRELPGQQAQWGRRVPLEPMAWGQPAHKVQRDQQAHKAQQELTEQMER